MHRSTSLPFSVRLVLPIGAVAITFALRILLEPFTGTGAPFILFFSTVVLTSLYLGPGFGVLTLVLCVPIATYAFAIRGGTAVEQGVAQASVFAFECLFVIYFSAQVSRSRRIAELAAERERRASNLREDLMATVSHDLRSPLSTIRLAAELIVRQAKVSNVENIERPTDVILRSSAQMTELIDELLDVTRVEAGELKIVPLSEAAVPLVREAVEQFRPLAEKKRLTLQFGELDDLIVRCERGRVAQVLANLIGNAIKFSGEGGSVTVSIARRQEFAEFTVKDRGSGIAAAQLPYLFERYWQGRKSRSSREGVGVGLGLAIAKGIVETHGGRIWAKSDEGKGAAFFFTIPLANESATMGSLVPNLLGL